MENKKTAVFGIFSTVAQAERAVDTLVNDRFSNNDISVLMPDAQSSKDFAHEKATTAPEGTTTGVAAGGTIGGTPSPPRAVLPADILHIWPPECGAGRSIGFGAKRQRRRLCLGGNGFN